VIVTASMAIRARNLIRAESTKFDRTARTVRGYERAIRSGPPFCGVIATVDSLADIERPTRPDQLPVRARRRRTIASTSSAATAQTSTINP
jgi:hypothetical protein